MLNRSRSSSCSSTKSHQSFWSRIGKLFHSRSHKEVYSSSTSSNSSCELPRRDNYSTSTLSTTQSTDFDSHSTQRRHRKQLVHQEEASGFVVPPFSPTYLKSNEFPYSNFYVKLPDGRWMVRYRDGNRDILRTDFMDGYLI
ncbi:hypothetical protein BY458DRAFT_501934 [Sporodiniella umbellata]|nr:hypothetical protein BY458DRAFT_501934 [Sporodiniella umbellata]